MRDRDILHTVSPLVDRHVSKGGYLSPFVDRRIALHRANGTIVAVLPELYAFVIFVEGDGGTP